MIERCLGNSGQSQCYTRWILIAIAFGLSLSQDTATAWAQKKPKPEDGLKVAYQLEDGDKGEIVAKVAVEAEDGGMLLLATDGRLVLVQANEISAKETVPKGWLPESADSISENLMIDVGEGFRIHKTKHYLFCYNTSEEYAKWTGSLFERLHRGFYNYWNSRGWKLEEPQFPLVVMVFDSKASYLKFASKEVGAAAESIVGYYSMMSNQVITYDLTGIERDGGNGQRVNRQELITNLLSRPEAERNVATIVHEAVHQIAYNSGMQVRLADNPVWVSEGLAVFFESPDLNSDKQGWGTIGMVNRHNFQLFLQYAPSRDEGSLVQLLTDDNRFRDPKTMAQAYSECWAFNYYLLNRKKKQYVEYLKHLAKQPPLGESTPEERITVFKKYLGDDLRAIDRDFIKFMSTLQSQ